MASASITAIDTPDGCVQIDVDLNISGDEAPYDLLSPAQATIFRLAEIIRSLGLKQVELSVSSADSLL